MDVITEYLNAWNAHNSSRIEACFTQGGIYTDSNLNQEISVQDFALRAQELFNCFPDFQVHVTDRTTTTSGLVATRWTITGTLPNTVLSGVDMLYIQDNKIQSIQVYFDGETGKLFAKVPSLHLKYDPDHLKKVRNSETSSNQSSALKYRTSGLSPEESKQFKQRLEDLTIKDKVHLNPEVNLSYIATKLGVSTNHLSQIINVEFQCNFYNYINRLRIKHAVHLLTNQPTMKSLAIALDSGFKSTSTFYSAFKTHTGTTPTAYKKQQSSPAL